MIFLTLERIIWAMKSYREHVKASCERCGHTPESRTALDVHHRDFNRANNDPSNLETLCPNCHRAIEHPNRGRGRPRKYPPNTKTLHLRLSPVLHAHIKKLAQAHDKTLNDTVTWLLRKELDKFGTL